MNRSKVLQVLLAVTLAISGGATSVQALQFTGDPHPQACDSCHNARGQVESVKGTQLRHNCVSCHSIGGAASRIPFSEEAMANTYGETPNVTPRGEGSWRSHNWFAKMINTKAGAKMPVASNMTYPGRAGYYDVGGVQFNTCTRCHFTHLQSESGAYPYVIGSGNLRDANDSDQMCNNCHIDRTVSPTISGSHPTNINYTSVWRTAKKLDNSNKYTSYAQYTSSFYKKPRNKNAANPTSQLSNYYKGGKIVCSTCHSIHYGDSDSATFDNRSTANGGNGQHYSHSSGMLLRTDQFGATTDDVNVCTNCHKDGNVNGIGIATGSRTRSHNNAVYGVNQNVQCVDCHGAHVDESDGTLNQKLILRTLAYSSARLNAKGNKVSFTTGAMDYKNAAGTGVCQGCHPVPTSSMTNPRTGANYPSSHDVATGTAATCAGCHPHNARNGGFAFDSAGCSQCHGYPPPPKASALLTYTTSETATAHRTHSAGLSGATNRDLSKYAYECSECHYAGQDAVRHDNGNARDVFNPADGGVSTMFGGVPTYNAVARTCNTVYCHSNGAPAGTATFKITPDWKNGKTTCTSCHENGATLVTGSHAKHFAKGYTCQACHKSTVNGTNAIISKSMHANGSKNLSFLVSGSANQAVTPVTCSNSCHYNPDTMANYPAEWGNAATGACGTCHKTSNVIAPGSGATIASQAHTAHLKAGTGAVGPELGDTINACQTCHIYSSTTNHVNGLVDRKAGDCTACHPNAAPTWSNPASVSCRSCHIGTASIINLTAVGKGIYTAPLMNTYTTMGHGKSFGSSGSVSGTIPKIDCNSCHDPASRHIGGTAVNHRMTQPELDLCRSCHNQEWSTAGVVRTKLVTKTHAVVGETSATQAPSELCSKCHDQHGSTNKRMIRNLITFHPNSTPFNVAFTNDTTGFVQNVYPYRGLCQICHTKTTYYKRGVVSVLHQGGNKKCLNCHAHQPADTTSNMAFAPFGQCNSCHGYPPVKSMVGLGKHNNYSTARLETDPSGYVGGGGAHAVAGHIGSDLTIVNPINDNCTNCHSQYPGGHNENGSTVLRANIKVVVNPAFTFQAGTAPTYNKATNTCSNVSCHYAPTPTW